jgi:hypothetical protein
MPMKIEEVFQVETRTSDCFSHILQSKNNHLELFVLVL